MNNGNEDFKRVLERNFLYGYIPSIKTEHKICFNTGYGFRKSTFKENRGMIPVSSLGKLRKYTDYGIYSQRTNTSPRKS